VMDGGRMLAARRRTRRREVADRGGGQAGGRRSKRTDRRKLGEKGGQSLYIRESDGCLDNYMHKNIREPEHKQVINIYLIV